MAADQRHEYNLLQLKVALEHQSTVLETILRTVQDVQCLSMKTDKRVGVLEMEVKQLLSQSSAPPKVQASLPAATNVTSNFNNSSSVREENVDCTRAEETELKSVVTAEVRRLGDVCTQRQGELLSKLDIVDQLLLPKLSEMSVEIKNTAAHLEMLEKGTRDLENSMNEYTSKLSDIQENLVPKNEMKNMMQTLSAAANEQKSEVNCKLTKLTDTSESLLSTVVVIKSGLEPPMESVNQIVSKLYMALTDQLLAEGQLIRECVQQSRKVRTSYTCDFIVMNFAYSIESSIGQCSRSWYVDQAKTHVKGYVYFSKDEGKMDIWLVHGRNPHLLGLEPIHDAPVVRVTVSALRLIPSKGSWTLGSKEMDLDETEIDATCDSWEHPWGRQIASVPFSRLTSADGYVVDNRLLLRYKISVL